MQKILGRVAQLLNDNNSVMPNQLQKWLETQEPPIIISQAKMTLEEKVGQMNQFVGVEHIKANEAHLSPEDLKTNTAQAYYPGFPAPVIEQWTKDGVIGSFTVSSASVTKT